MRPTYAPLLGLLLALAACGTPGSVPHTMSLSSNGARSAQDAPGRSRCGDADDCAHIRLVAPLEPHLLRGLTLMLESPQCASAMIPPHFDLDGESFPLDATTFTTPFNGMRVEAGIAPMNDPCAENTDAHSMAVHRMNLVPGPIGPPPGAVQTDYFVIALQATVYGTMSGVTVEWPAYELDGTLYFEPGATLELMRGDYAFYLARRLRD